MRKPIVVLLLAAFTMVMSPPAVVRAETTDLYVKSPQQVMDELRASAVNGELVGAISRLQDYIRSHPDLPAPQRLLGDFYFRKPDFQAAERTYKAILSRWPNDSETWNRLGGLYSAEDRVDDAIAAFNRSVPEPNEYYNLVALHRLHGDLAQFETQIATQAQNDPTNERDLLIYGTVLRAVRKTDQAITVFKEALSINDPIHRCPALNDLALAFLDQRRVGDAMPLLQRCLAIEPQNYSALVNIGEANIELGLYDPARSYLNRAIKARIDGPEAYVDIGFIEDAAHNWKTAVSDYEKAIAVDPLWRDAYIDLGYDYYVQKLYTLAEAAFIKGLSVAPRDGRLSSLLGMTYRDQGKVALAKQQYERAVSYGDEENIVTAARRDLSELEAQPQNTTH
jgi:protein O-GlcNAc transferase